MENNLFYTSNKKIRLGILANSIDPLKITNLKTRNKNISRLSSIKNENNKCKNPLINMDDSNF